MARDVRLGLVVVARVRRLRRLPRRQLSVLSCKNQRIKSAGVATVCFRWGASRLVLREGRQLAGRENPGAPTGGGGPAWEQNFSQSAWEQAARLSGPWCCPQHTLQAWWSGSPPHSWPSAVVHCDCGCAAAAAQEVTSSDSAAAARPMAGLASAAHGPWRQLLGPPIACPMVS